MSIEIENKALSRIFMIFSQENRKLASSEALRLGLFLAKGKPNCTMIK